MIDLSCITPDIYRLKIPFSNIYTSVFIIRTPDGTVVFDTASKDADAQNYIIPALEQLGLVADQIFISHNHGDHSGGLEALARHYSEATVITSNCTLQQAYRGRTLCPEDGQLLCGVLQVVCIPGHTPDAMALFDTRTGVLLSGDCLQAYGIFGAGPWGCAIRSVAVHFEAIEKLRGMAIQTLVTAHDYHPYRAVIEGREIGSFLDTCIQALLEIRDIILANPALDDQQLECLCNTRPLPRIDQRVIAGLRKAIAEKTI